ncbi:MAG: adenylyl-sulfate kinase [Saprospiraceae bacterium]|nr:adenylyl-sulfate kinase [Saprospiraceae bacterium]
MLLIQLTGLSGAGKTTLARAVQQQLLVLGHKVEIIDGDEYRRHLCSDLGFSKEDRLENIARLGFVGLTLARHGVIVLLSAINPYEQSRAALHLAGSFVKTVYLSCPLEILKTRDVKGLYRRAALPENHPERLEHFTGVDDPYEIPVHPELTLNTGEEVPEKSARRLTTFILDALVPAKNATSTETRPRALFVGRWQPFHFGHKWLIDQKLKQGVPVLVAVRDLPQDAQNPFTTAQTIAMIQRVYAGQPVEVMAIPDIESINYGRGVGYEVNCFIPPDDIGVISGTRIRRQIRARSDAWKEHVDGAIHGVIRAG